MTEIIKDVRQIIGMGALRKISKERAELKRMRVMPEFQRKGIGKNLLLLLEQKAVELGYSEMILDTSTKQIAALGLYEKSGYQEYKRGDLGGLETIYMIKPLVPHKLS